MPAKARKPGFGEDRMKHVIRIAVLIAIVAVEYVHAQQAASAKAKAGEPSAQAKDTELQAMHPTEEIVQPRVLSKTDLFSQDHTADIVAIESVWSAYVYYNDSHNGPDVASLFTDD